MAAAPPRMIRSGLGDSLCRPTAQADWLLAHLLFDQPYRTMPFVLLEADEAQLFWLGDASQRCPPIGVGGKRFDQLAALAPGDEAWIRRDVPITLLPRVGHPDHDGALGVLIWQRVDEQRLPHAEHRGR